MEVPDVIMCIQCLSFVLTGFVCARYPHLIAGVSTMKPEKKAKVDLKGLGKFMRKAMCLTGGVMLVVYVSLVWSGMERLSCYCFSTVLITIIGMVYVFIGSQKFIRK